MIVVSDTSPLLTLWKIGHLNLLQVLYGEVVIPPEVEVEIRADEHPDSARAIFDACKDWLTVRSPRIATPIPGLDPGEIAAIALAEELKADLLLIDEKLGRRIAVDRHLKIRGTLGVLEEAALRKLIDLRTAFESLKATDFRFPHPLLEVRLSAFEEQFKKA